jgi:hypothetical protein
MVRSISAVLVGVIAGVVVIFVAGRLTVGFYPVPEGFDPSRAADIAARPLGSKLAVVFAWFAGAFGGGLGALLVSKRWAPAAWVVAATILLFAGANFSAFPHPLWMMLASLPATAFGGWLAVRLMRARYGAPPGAAEKGLL